MAAAPCHIIVLPRTSNTREQRALLHAALTAIVGSSPWLLLSFNFGPHSCFPSGVLSRLLHFSRLSSLKAAVAAATRTPQAWSPCVVSRELLPHFSERFSKRVPRILVHSEGARWMANLDGVSALRVWHFGEATLRELPLGARRARVAGVVALPRPSRKYRTMTRVGVRLT